ncbi:MAG TPA: polyphosphate:AMP phosphotransferase [Burkholderiales bacterium]|nr:polyphosphate:AMP phosphotransferase [Burkholderiales bacterium]
MFESANLDHKVSKDAYKRAEPKLRAELLNAQYDLKENGRFPVLLLIAGVEGAGKGETVNQLNEWMDSRHVLTHGFAEPSDEERERPHLWRFWKALPPKGKVGVFFGAWHTDPIVQRVHGAISAGEFAEKIDEIVRLEKMLCDEGVLLLKYWFHVPRSVQKKRLKALGEPSAYPYRKYLKVSEAFVRRTSTAEAPWIIIAGGDDRYRSLTFGRHLLAAMRERLDDRPVKRMPDRHPPLVPPADHLNVLRALDLDRPLEKSEYRKQYEKLRARLNALSRKPGFRKTALVAVFEGNDAAGKGGAIRRVTSSVDARYCRTVSVAAPTEEERAQPYLWRFWRHLPRRGRLILFDRSWYGRLLVERVEGFAAEADWLRAYSEINDFERSMTRHDLIVVKFWLAISKEEQFRRFKRRETIAFKRFKITPEDWRNRKKWDLYEGAVCDMVDRTSTSNAPWTLVEANNKYYARIKVLKTLCDAIEKKLS